LIEESPASDALDRFEEALGHRFESRALLENALYHSSYAYEHPGLESNERLEFLGDSVLGLVVADALYRTKPGWREGELTRGLHALVEGRSLEQLARHLEVGAVIRLGRTERQSGGHDKGSILADAMEAIIGAIYLDSGLPAVTRLIERFFHEALAADAPAVERDPKTELQERVMEREGEFPSYRLLRDSEIEGDDVRFTVEVTLRDRGLAQGIGRTKRAAERKAAAAALADWLEDVPRES